MMLLLILSRLKHEMINYSYAGILLALLSVSIFSSLPPQATGSSPEAPGDHPESVPLDELEPNIINQQKVVNIIIVGATGDLSKRYLWQGFFNLINDEKDQIFHLYAGARIPQEDGEKEMKIILERNVSCSRLPASVVMTAEDCEKAKADYRDSVTYQQLKKPEDYSVLCSNIQQKMQYAGLKEKGRIVYFSVPAFAYAGIAENINKVCRPEGDAWLRAVVEKPFGHDLASAKELSASLMEHLAEDEIYRIDHYLGKTGVQSILPFRFLNQGRYGNIWNRENIERVEIVMKESLDSKGRIYFYDKYGVMRDVMQNHLTEILALVAMEVPSNLTSIHDYQREKLALLSQVDHVTAEQAVIGQYESYIEEWREETNKADNETTHVPSFAGILFFVSSPRWNDVPFLMVSGKKLDKKQTYVRIVFKNVNFCTVDPDYDEGDHSCRPKQIIFTIGSGKYPTVAVSKSLPEPEVPKSWSIPDIDLDTSILGSKVKDFHVYSAGPEADAYSVLVRECYHGNRDKFIGTSELEASWDIWTPLLADLEGIPPRIYPGGIDSQRWLDLEIRGRKLSFSHSIISQNEFDMPPAFAASRNSFRSDALYTGSLSDTVYQLANHLLAAARSAIASRGVFHIAFPGGSTPEALFLHLFTHMRYRFPWRETHVWFTDERCVPLTSEDSNFNLIYSKLLQYVSIPYTHIHPMPVQLTHGLCHTEDAAPELYSAEIKRLIPDQRFDYILLGVGEDGHIASLFPNHETLKDKINIVIFSDGAVQSSIPDRLSLTFKAINSAKHVTILILGNKKHTLVEKLEQTDFKNATELPILSVSPSNGTLSWFLDHNALHG